MKKKRMIVIIIIREIKKSDVNEKGKGKKIIKGGKFDLKLLKVFIMEI